MRRKFVEPEMRVIAINVGENIASSGDEWKTISGWPGMPQLGSHLSVKVDSAGNIVGTIYPYDGYQKKLNGKKDGPYAWGQIVDNSCYKG